MSSENPKTIVVSAVGDAILMVIVIQLTNVLAMISSLCVRYSGINFCLRMDSGY